ncbi:breast cancer type 2 susceptibility protein homolog [Drosophila montana]|uniref:breast cancer type 2 susceptibility protein homolog n=1 Tax=Drosophila montana TaxID=40370 RepID=UPI00313EF04A
MEDDDDDDYSIDASPTKPSPSCSKRSELLLRRKTRTVQENYDIQTKRAPVTQWPCGTPHQQPRLDLVSAWELREEQLFEADRLDCLRAQQEPLRVRSVPASQNFNSLQSMLESQEMPMQQASPEPEATEQLLSKPSSIVQEILRDFCSSPTYVEEQLPTDDASPWFRFRSKKIKTFGHKRPTAIAASTADDEDRLSCSSELSVQEDYTTQVPTTTHCAFDANSSQKICENLLNLSAFFSQNNVNKSIDLPDMQVDPKNCTAIEAMDYEQEDATDVVEDMGYFLGSTEQCKFYDENCDIKITDDAEFSLFSERSRLLTRETPLKVGQSQDTSLCGDWFKADFITQKLKVPLDKTETQNLSTSNAHLKAKESELLEGIPLSEWQPIDIAPSANINLISASEKKELQATDCKQLELIAFSEWQPDASEFRTVSSKPIKVFEQHQKEAAKLMADVEASYTQKPSEVVNGRDSAGIQFRTASNKTMKITEEMRRKAAMLMADLETVVENQSDAQGSQMDRIPGSSPNKTLEAPKQMQKGDVNSLAELGMNTAKREEVTADCEMLDGIPFSEWQPMDIPDSKPTPAESYVCSQLDMIPFSEWQPMDIPDAVEFRTASNKTIQVSEEKQQEAAKFMADIEASYSQKIGADRSIVNIDSDVSVNVEFRTASNKIVKLTEEMRQRAAMLMADLETGSLNPQETTKEQLEEVQKNANEGSEANQNRSLHSEISENIEFRTASNKIVKLTDEMRQRAAMLMADLEVGSLNQQEEEKEQLDKVQLKRCAPRNISESVVFGNLSRKLTTEEDIEKGIPEPTSDSIDGITPFAPETRIGLITATPQPNLVTQKNSETLNVPFETPKCTPELQSSLTQLSERSPLDKATKSSIITRRNLLSLNKRRKQKRDAENCSADAGRTPIRRFAPMAASTSTPMPNRKDSVEGEAQRVMRDRSCSQESPRVHRERVGKRKSEEALSPIYAPTTKTRRLGLSRIRNKSNHDI